MKLFFSILFAICLYLQTISTVPFVLLALIIYTVIKRQSFVIPVAFILGVILDTLTLKQIGASSIFFTVLTFLILIYQSKFEIETNLFVFLASFFASFAYLTIDGNQNILIQSLVSSLVAFLLFFLMKKIKKEKPSFEGNPI